jgi:hypothetical protein
MICGGHHVSAATEAVPPTIPGIRRARHRLSARSRRSELRIRRRLGIRAEPVPSAVGDESVACRRRIIVRSVSRPGRRIRRITYIAAVGIRVATIRAVARRIAGIRSVGIVAPVEGIIGISVVAEVGSGPIGPGIVTQTKTEVGPTESAPTSAPASTPTSAPASAIPPVASTVSSEASAKTAVRSAEAPAAIAVEATSTSKAAPAVEAASAVEPAPTMEAPATTVKAAPAPAVATEATSFSTGARGQSQRQQQNYIEFAHKHPRFKPNTQEAIVQTHHGTQA